jgi:hypothetical protein
MKMIMFHVERHPIQKATPHFWPASNEIMNLRIDNLKWQRIGQRRDAAVAATINSNLQPVSAVSNAELPLPPVALRFPEKNKLGLPVANKIRSSRPTE